LTALRQVFTAPLLYVVPLGQLWVEQLASCSAAAVHSATVIEPRALQEDSLLQAALAKELQAAAGVLVSEPQPKKATAQQRTAKV
jgi:hypothetical protein